MRPGFRRQAAINRLRAQLERTGFPRLKMAFIVGLTGGVGFIASFSMLRHGVVAMAVRYPVAIAIAYLAFLFFLWMWLRWSAKDYVDIPDFSGLGARSDRGAYPCGGSGQGSDDGGILSDVAGSATGAGDFAIPLVILAAAAGLLVASFWIVYRAPVLFAELLLDGMLAASLYRRLRGIETRYWLTTAIRRTFWPFLITALVAGVGGKMLQAHVPGARTLGEVVAHFPRNHG